MRWIDRGPEPEGVADYARRFTPGWIDYFQNGIGWRPDDSCWREFRPRLGERSNNICWYCEQQCTAAVDAGGRAATVDHFQPISRFPQLAYAWSNWIFSCQRCNESKGNRWPETGYVDPCAATAAERPEQYFDYDADTGEILPRNGLSGAAQRKAWDTIDDLGLNNGLLSGLRKAWTDDFRRGLRRLSASDQDAFIATVVGRPVEYAGVTGMMMEQLRREGRV